MTTKSKPAKPKKLTPAEFERDMRRERVQRVVDSEVEYRAHHAALGAGWLCLTRWRFTPDEGQPLTLGSWLSIVLGRARHALAIDDRKQPAYYPGDLDYTSLQMRDGSVHEFRHEFLT